MVDYALQDAELCFSDGFRFVLGVQTLLYASIEHLHVRLTTVWWRHKHMTRDELMPFKSLL
jgi:hypothetical protein